MIGIHFGGALPRKMGLLLSEPNYQKGAGLLIRDPYYQNGSGFFSFLTRGLKMLSPILKKGANVVKKVVTSNAGKKITSKLSDSALDIAADVVGDVIQGKDPKENLKENLSSARSNISKTLKEELRKRKSEDSPILGTVKKKRKNKVQRKKVRFQTIL